jgi:hypothetical protein
VQLVEDPQLSCRKLVPEYLLPVLRDVPIEIPLTRSGNRQDKSGLADLPRSGDEHHLALQVGLNLGGEIPCFRGHVALAKIRVFLTGVKTRGGDFLL